MTAFSIFSLSQVNQPDMYYQPHRHYTRSVSTHGTAAMALKAALTLFAPVCWCVMAKIICDAFNYHHWARQKRVWHGYNLTTEAWTKVGQASKGFFLFCFPPPHQLLILQKWKGQISGETGQLACAFHLWNLTEKEESRLRDWKKNKK